MTDIWNGCPPYKWTKPKYPGPDGLPKWSDGYRLIEFCEKYWTLPGERPGQFRFDEWQKTLLILILETDEDGHLLRRQVLVSVGRQNGKSLLGAVLQTYGLLQHTRGCSVVGLATNVKQASIVYDRVSHTVLSNPALSRKLKATGTRGIRHRDGSGSLYVLPAKADSLQGEPVTFGLCDELHVLPASIYHAILNGQRAQADSLLVGITTAGDATSELLLDLYDKADEAIADPDTRFGVFIWQALEGSKVKDPDAIRAANPAIACGRIDIETVLADTAKLPDWDAKRFLLNQFVSNVNVWMDPHIWDECSGKGITERSTGVHYAIDISPSMGFASIAAAKKRSDGTIETEIVASLTNPSIAELTELCLGLKRAESFAMDPYRLGDLAKALEDRGKKVHRLAQGGNTRAAATAYSLIGQRKVSHARDALVRKQFKNGVAKNSGGDGWKIVPVKTGQHIDGLMATVFAIYAAEVSVETGSMLYVA